MSQTQGGEANMAGRVKHSYAAADTDIPTRRGVLDRGLKTFALGALCASLAIGAARPAFAAKEYFFDFANILESGELFKQMGDGIENAAKVAGVRMNRYNNNNDGPT